MSQQQNQQADLGALKSALDDSSDKNRNFLIAFFLLEIYLAVTVISTTDLNLFLADSIFAFPFIELQVSLVAFFVMAPLVLVAFHYNLLFNLLEHCKILREWLYHPDNKRLANFNLLPAFMFNIRAKYDYYPESPRTANYYLLNAIIIFMVSLSPLMVMGLILWHFASFQNLWISLWHLLLVLASLALHVIYWLRLQKPKLLKKKYDHFGTLYNKLFKHTDILSYLLLVLAICLIRITGLIAGMSMPTLVAPYMDNPVMNFVIPHINIEGEQIRPLMTIDSDSNEMNSLLKHKRTQISQDSLPGHIELEPVNECYHDVQYQQTELPERHFKLANFSNVVLCNVNLQEADLSGARMRNSVFSGQFDLANLSAVDLSHSQLQQNTSLVQTTLLDADLSYLRANKVNFTMADLTRATLWASELTLTEFLQANLFQAKFTLSQTNFTNFRGANLAEARFDQTHLRGVDLRFAHDFDHSVTLTNSTISDCYVDDINVLKKVGHYLNANCNIYNSNLLTEGSVEQEFVAQLRAQFKPNPVTALANKNQNSTELIDRILSIAKLSETHQINLSNLSLSHIPLAVTALEDLEKINLGYNHLNADQLLTTTLMPNLQVLDFGSNEAVTVPKEIAQLNQLTDLNLSTNQLIALPNEFEQLKKMTRLNLSDNLFSAMPKALNQLSNLETLNLRGNKLTGIPKQIEQLAQLRDLSFANNQINSVPNQISQLSHLLSLDLSSNELLVLPQDIGQLTRLEELNLNDNSLTALPDEIGHLTSLKSLVVSINQLSELPASIGNLTLLPKLNLQSNLLNALPQEITRLTHITELDLSDNEFENFPNHISELKQLSKLSLKGNAFEVLPPVIGKMTTLTSLDLGGTELSELPQEIGNLKVLTELYLQGNQLTGLPPELSRLSQLKILDLSANQIDGWQNALAGLTQLTDLALAYNGFEQLPEQISGLNQLERLKLESNQLKVIPKQIGDLPHLLTLNLANNQLTELPYETRRLQQLQTLYLNNNRFDDLPEVVGQLEQLRKLNLANNNLTTLPQALGALKELKDLNLSGNELTHLPEEIVNLPLLETLYVRGNKLVSPPQKVANRGLGAIRAWFAEN